MGAKQEQQRTAVAQTRAFPRSAAGLSGTCDGTRSAFRGVCSSERGGDVAAFSEVLPSTVSSSTFFSSDKTKDGELCAAPTANIVESPLLAQCGKTSTSALHETSAATGVSRLPPSTLLRSLPFCEDSARHVNTPNKHRRMSSSASPEQLLLPVLSCGDPDSKAPTPGSELHHAWSCSAPPRWSPALQQAVAVSVYVICLLEKVFCFSLEEYLSRDSLPDPHMPYEDRAASPDSFAPFLLRQILSLKKAGNPRSTFSVEPHCGAAGPRNFLVSGRGSEAAYATHPGKTAAPAGGMVGGPTSPSEPDNVVTDFTPAGGASALPSPAESPCCLAASPPCEFFLYSSAPVKLCPPFLPSLLQFIRLATRTEASDGGFGLSREVRPKQKQQAGALQAAIACRKVPEGGCQQAASCQEAGGRVLSSRGLACEEKRKVALLRALRRQARSGVTGGSGGGRPGLRCLQQKQLPTTLVEAATKAAAEQLKTLKRGPQLQPTGQFSAGIAPDASLLVSAEPSSLEHQTGSRRGRLREKKSNATERRVQRLNAACRVESEPPGHTDGAGESQGSLEMESQQKGESQSKDLCQHDTVGRKRGMRRAARRMCGRPREGEREKEANTAAYVSEVSPGTQGTRASSRSAASELKTALKSGKRKPTTASGRMRSSRGSVSVADDDSQERAQQRERRGTANQTQRKMRNGSRQTAEEFRLGVGDAFEGLPVRLESGEDSQSICDRRVVGFPLVCGSSGKTFTEEEAWQMVQAATANLKKREELQGEDPGCQRDEETQR